MTDPLHPAVTAAKALFHQPPAVFIDDEAPVQRVDGGFFVTARIYIDREIFNLKEEHHETRTCLFDEMQGEPLCHKANEPDPTTSERNTQG